MKIKRIVNTPGSNASYDIHIAAWANVQDLKNPTLVSSLYWIDRSFEYWTSFATKPTFSRTYLLDETGASYSWKFDWLDSYSDTEKASFAVTVSRNIRTARNAFNPKARPQKGYVGLNLT